MVVPARLNIVTLGVTDLARSVSFYEGLGWRKAKSSMDEIAWFELTGTYLGLFGYDELAADAGLPDKTRGEGFGGVTLAMNLESPDAVSATLDAAAAAGATIIKQGTKMDWGGFSGYFADPDGYPWEVAHNPNFPINTDGTITIP